MGGHRDRDLPGGGHRVEAVAVTEGERSPGATASQVAISSDARMMFFLFQSVGLANTTPVSGVIRAACGAVISDHPYNTEYGAECLRGPMADDLSICARSRAGGMMGDWMPRLRRLIDTAAEYGNAVGAGRGIRDSGVPRSELFISKLRGSDQARDPRAGALASIDRLDPDYLDLYLRHWPLPALGCTSRRGK
jgi:hypothetical protein